MTQTFAPMWKIRVLNRLWAAAQTGDDGLLVPNVGDELRKVGIRLQWHIGVPQPPEELDLRSHLRAGYQYKPEKSLPGMRDWLQAHFPVYFTGTNDNTVVFLYRSQVDYAAIMMFETLRKHNLAMPYAELQHMLGENWGLEEGDIRQALEAYPEHFVQTADGSVKLIQDRLKVDMPEGIAPLLQKELIAAISSTKEGYILQSALPNAVPAIKAFFGKGELSTWLAVNCPALEVAPHPENDSVKIARLASAGGRRSISPVPSGTNSAVSTGWRAQALRVLWDAAQRPVHKAAVGTCEVEASGLMLHEVEPLLQASGISWRTCRQNASQTLEQWLEASFPVCLHDVQQENCSFTRVLFLVASLADYAACRACEILKGVIGMPYDKLVEQLFSEHGLTSDSVDEAFQLHDNALIRGMVGNGQMQCRMASRVILQMPEEIRAHVEQKLRQAIEASPTKRYPLAKVQPLAPFIQWYYSSTAGSLKTWLLARFTVEVPEQHPHDICLCDSTRWLMVALREQLSRFAGLSARISELPELTRAAGFDLQTALGDTPLEQWLETFMAETGAQRTRDGESIYLPAPEDAYPDLPILHHHKVEDEMRQAQQFCYYPWDVLRQLAILSGHADKESYKFPWNRYFSTLLAEALSGVNGSFMYDNARHPMRAVLNTRMSTPEGEPLYAVLEENPPHQPNLFRLLGIVSPGMADADGLGYYLTETFGLTGISSAQQSFASLTTLVEQLTALQTQLLRETSAAAEAVQNGYADLPEGLAANLRQWTEDWQEAGQLVVSLGWRQDFEERLTLDALRARVQASTLENQLLDDAKSRFDTMVDRIDQFLQATPYYDTALNQCCAQLQTDRKDAACTRISSREDMLEFRELLLPYREMRALAESDMMHAFTLLNELPTMFSHFAMPQLLAGQLFVGTADHQLACLSELDEIAKLLDNIINQIDRQEQSAHPQQVVAAGVLFEQLNTRTDSGTLFPVAPIFPEDELEAMIVRGEFNTAVAWLNEHPLPSSEAQASLLAGLKVCRDMDTSLSLLAIGRRLYRLGGNRSQTAERYLLSACLQCRKPPEEAKQLLLEIYRLENRPEAFSLLFRDVQGMQDLENRKYYLYILCSGDYGTMRAYLDQHIYLLYDARCLEKVRHAAETAGDTAFLQLLQGLNAIGTPQGNALSDSIEAGRMQEAQALAAVEWTEDDAVRLQVALADADTMPTGSDAASVGCRLYQCLGNWRRLAEKRLWDALASGERTVYTAAAVQLTQLLADESRWAECRMVYEHYSRECDTSDEARCAYLVCLLITNPAGAMELIRTNMQDVLNLYLSGEQHQQLVTTLCNSSDARIASFFSRVASLCSHLQNEFYRSVIIPGRNLREMLAQPEKVRDLGFTEQEEENIKLLRRTNDYPRGMSPASIAERVFRFVGARGGVAEDFADFAMPKPEMAELLRKIYLALDERHDLLKLMQNTPTLRDAHRDEYCRLLLSAGNTDELQAAFAEQAPATPEQRLIAQIISVQADGAVNADFDRCCTELLQCDPALVTGLFAALGTRQLESEIYRLASSNIERMLSEWPVETILDALTGGSTLDEQALQNLQNHALENDCQVLAIMLWSNLKIGDLKALADETYNQLLRSASADQQLQQLSFFRKVFPDQSDYLALQALLIDLKQPGSDSPEQLAVKISEQLAGVRMDADRLTALLQAMSPELLQQEAIMSCLSQLAQAPELQRVCMEQYHQLALRLDMNQVTSQFADYLTDQYLTVMSREDLPAPLLTQAADLSFKYAAKFRTENPLLSTACLALRCGQAAQADFILHEALAETEDAPVGKRLQEAADMRWPNGVPTLLTLFQEVLLNCELDDVLDYCLFCSRFIPKVDAAPVISGGDTLLTDTECDAMLYHLFANPHDATRWLTCADKLPMQGAPRAHARLKMISCRMGFAPHLNADINERNARWRACAEFCADRALDEHLLETLLYWSDQSVKAFEQHDKIDRNKYFIPVPLCQFIADFDKDNGGLPACWATNFAPQLHDLLKRLIRLITPSDGPLQKEAIIASSAVAVSSPDPTLLADLLTEKHHELLKIRPNLTAALVARLLLAQRFEEARQLLEMLMATEPDLRFQAVMETLRPMDADELAAWCANSENRQLATLMLPNGEMPPAEVVIDWCMEQIRTGNFDTGLELCRMLCQAFPKNRVFARTMFYTLKNCGLNRSKLRLLHEALQQIIGSASNSTTEDYEIRTQTDFAYLLAGLNSVLIDMGETEGIAGYDFTKPAGDYLRSCALSNEADNVNRWQQYTSDLLLNQQQEMRERIWRVIISWITGDWYDVLLEAWHDTDRWSGVLKIAPPVTPYGLGRSVMRFLYELPAGERENAVTWVQRIVADTQDQMKGVKCALTYLNRIGDQAAAQDVMTSILSYPLEESAMGMQMLNSILNPALLVNMNTARFYATAALALMACPRTIQAATIQAYASFCDRESRKAAASYYALEKVVGQIRIIPPLFKAANPRPVTDEDITNWVQRFSNLRYLTILLADDPELFSNSLNRALRSGQFFNLVLNLLCTDRANEALLLRRKLPRDFRSVVDTMLLLIDPRVPDQDKVQYVNEITNDQIRMTALFFLSIYTKEQPTSCYLNNRMVAMACHEQYKQLKREGLRGEMIFWKNMRPKWKLAARQIQPPKDEPDVTDEVPAMEEQTADPASDNAQIDAVASVLHAAVELLSVTPLLPAEADPLPTPAAYARLPVLNPSERQQKMDMSLQLYRLSLAPGSELKRIDWLTRYCLDRFMDSKEPDNTTLQLALLVATVTHFCDDQVRSDFKKQAVSILRNLLRCRYNHLREQLNEYHTYKNGYIALRDMLTDDESSKVIQSIYKVLEMLIGSYEQHSASDSEQLREVLREAESQLQSIRFLRILGDATSELRSMVLNEFNQLDALPRLSLTVLNRGACQYEGKLFGQVKNLGRTEACDIQLRASFGDGHPTEPYLLPRLAAGASAVFAIGYIADDTIETLSWQLEGSCTDKNGTRLRCQPCRGELELTDEAPAYFDAGKMNTQTITDFTPTANGRDVESPDFIGRESEKRRLRSLYEDLPFSRCRNGLLYGIRRSGKTSLLNYLEAYLNTTRTDLAAVLVDGQSAHTTVRDAFITCVLKRLLHLGKLDNETYKALTERWAPPSDPTDIDPRLLTDFYCDVKQAMNGCGLVIIFDEFDRLLEKLDSAQSLESSFYPVLSSMLCDTICAQTVHFLFCGSKELKVEINKDRQVTQVYQRIGESDIVIGAMPKHEMIEMVRKPLSLYSHVVFTDEALELLWNLVGGLVWFSKLVAKDALENAKRDRRSVVYPSDILDVVKTYAERDAMCKQFYEGFREDERIVVEALSNAAIRPFQYVSLAQTVELLQLHISRERIERALRNMAELEMVEVSRQNSSQYRFRVDLYRRYFRKQTEYGRLLSQTAALDMDFCVSNDR